MAILVTFVPVAMTTDQYDEVIQRLDAVGAGAPEGRTYHVAAGEFSSLQVIDVWDSMEAFESFGESLMPILQQLGVSIAAPEIREIYSIVEG